MVVLTPIRLIAVVVFAVAAMAEETVFDGAVFQAPEGWPVERGSDFVAFTQADPARRTFCRIAVYGMPAGGKLAAEEFARAWKAIVSRAFPAASTPAPSPARTGTGMEYLAGASVVLQNGRQFFANLFVFPGGPRLMSILVIVSSQEALQAYRSPIAAFLQSFRLAHSGPPPTPARAAAEVGSFASGGIAGVWMGFRNMPLLRDYEPRPRWITFFDDGQVFEDIPLAGLRGFDRDANKRDAGQKFYWGTYRYRDGQGVIEKPGAQFTTRIRGERPGQIKLDDLYSYSKCARIDGLRLQGAWTSYANLQEEPWLRLPVGRRSVIRFNQAGAFVDEGIFIALLTTVGDKSQSFGGSGTYEIRDFTLSLRYADGRTKQVAITGFLAIDPAINDDMLYIGRAIFRKIK